MWTSRNEMWLEAASSGGCARGTTVLWNRRRLVGSSSKRICRRSTRWAGERLHPVVGSASLLDPAAAAAARPVFLPAPEVPPWQEVPALRAMPSRCQEAPGADEDD